MLQWHHEEAAYLLLLQDCFFLQDFNSIELLFCLMPCKENLKEDKIPELSNTEIQNNL